MRADAGSQFPAEFAGALPEIVDSLVVGVIIVDSGLAIRGWNRWMEEASGLYRADVTGRHIAEAVPTARPVLVEALRSAVEGKTTLLSHSLHRYLVELPSPAGSSGFDQMQQAARVAPIEHTGGGPGGAIAFIQDVTDRVERERDLRAATEIAEKANLSKSDFLATMSHELRTPIGAMSGYVDLILEGIYGPVTADQKRHLMRVKTVGRHLLDIVEEILLFARVEAGREVADIANADAYRIARDAAALIAPIASEKGLELILSIPEAAEPLRTDEVKVRQILINLLGNAVKFTPSGKVTLSAVNDTASGLVTYSVCDSGVGIPPEHIETIFEPFAQVTTGYSRTQSGTGLGLSVSRRLAQMLGGNITVESEPGKGSTFVATIASKS